MSKIRSLARYEITFLLTAITGGFMILQYYIDIPQIKSAGSQLMVWNVIIISWVAFIGLFNTTVRHYRKVIKETDPSERFLSAYFLVLMYGAIIIGLWTGTKEGLYPWIYGNTYGPIRMAVNALPALYLFSAASKAFLAKTKETVCFLVAGGLVLLRNAPISMAIWKGFGTLGDFVLDIPMIGVQRALIMTVGISVLSYGIKILIGGEKQ